MKAFLTLEEVRKRSLPYVLYLLAITAVIYIFFGLFGWIKLLFIQYFIDLFLIGLIFFLLHLYKKEQITYKQIVYIGLVVGFLDATFILIFNNYNELRLLWFFLLVPFAYLYGGKYEGIITSSATLLVMALLEPYLGYTSQAFLTFYFVVIILSLVLLFFIINFEILSNVIYKTQQELDRSAHMDYLTGVLNRRGFFEAMTHMKGGILALCDLDDFKVINDTYGHKVGDLYLKAFVKELQEATRSSDIVARLGGDEFVVFFKNAKVDGIKQKMERFYKEHENKKFMIDEIELPLRFSCGITSLSESIDKSLERADRALYEAKKDKHSFRVC